MLAAHRILSAPVVTTATEGREHPDSAEPSERTKDVAGFIDIRDILSSFLQGQSVPAAVALTPSSTAGPTNVKLGCVLWLLAAAWGLAFLWWWRRRCERRGVGELQGCGCG